jgi:hypothetical protein
VTGRWFANRRSSGSGNLDVVDRARLIARGPSRSPAERWARIATVVAALALLIPAIAYIRAQLVGNPVGEIVTEPSETRLPHVFEMTIVDPLLASVGSGVPGEVASSLVVPAIDPAAPGAPIDPAEPSGGAATTTPQPPGPNAGDEATQAAPPSTTSEVPEQATPQPIVPPTQPNAARPLPVPTPTPPRTVAPPTTVDVVVTTVPPPTGPPTTVDVVVTTVPRLTGPPTTIDVINGPSSTSTPTTTTTLPPPPTTQLPLPLYPRDGQLCVETRIGLICIPWEFTG